MIKLIGVYDYTVILTYLSLFSALFGMTQAGHGRYGPVAGKNFPKSESPAVFYTAFCGSGYGDVHRSEDTGKTGNKGFSRDFGELCRTSVHSWQYIINHNI